MKDKIEFLDFVKKDSFIPAHPEWKIFNGIITRAGTDVIGHFGNIVTLDLAVEAENGWCGCFMPTYNLTLHIGYIIKALMETLDENDDNPKSFSSLVGKPCRVISSMPSFVGIGHFIKDRWLIEPQVQEWMKANNLIDR